MRTSIKYLAVSAFTASLSPIAKIVQVGGDIDFLATQTGNSGWVAKMINFLADPPGWALTIIVFVVVFLLHLSQRARIAEDFARNSDIRALLNERAPAALVDAFCRREFLQEQKAKLETAMAAETKKFADWKTMYQGWAPPDPSEPRVPFSERPITPAIDSAISMSANQIEKLILETFGEQIALTTSPSYDLNPLQPIVGDAAYHESARQVYRRFHSHNAHVAKTAASIERRIDDEIAALSRIVTGAGYEASRQS